MWDYTDKVKEYFFDPKNAGVLEEANAVGEVGAIACGDALKLMLSVDPQTETITAAKFQTFGCGSAIASSSALTEIIIGKTLDDALKITNQDIADFLGGLPPEKMHCSVMGYEALQAAVAHYRGEEWADDHEEGALVCKCFGIDAAMIERTIRSNELTTLEQVTNYTKAGGGCMTCFETLEEILAKTNADMVEEGLIAAGEAYSSGSTDVVALKKKSREDKIRAKELASAANAPIQISGLQPLKPTEPEPAPVKRPVMTTLQKVRLVEKAIEDIRPFLKADGGDCELVDVDGDAVYVKLSGACVGCQMASVTINGVRQKLVDATGMPLRVIPVS